MPIDLVNYEDMARLAVREFWNSRQSSAKKQQDAGKQDQGERAAVTAGKNMDAFVELVRELVCANGLAATDIMLKRRLLTLPGFFRPTKLWDMLVVHHGRLVAALEFKSQVGSFGNNANNRTEEAIGNAIDLWTAYREGAFGKEVPPPFIGYLMLVEDAPGSRAPIRDASPHFPIFPEFRNASYAERYNVLCHKLVQEKLYTAAAVLLSPRSAGESGEYSEMSELTGLRMYLTNLAGHVSAEAARSTVP
jgi:restriction endonuclease XhoI-like protein